MQFFNQVDAIWTQLHTLIFITQRFNTCLTKLFQELNLPKSMLQTMVNYVFFVLCGEAIASINHSREENCTIDSPRVRAHLEHFKTIIWTPIPGGYLHVHFFRIYFF